MNHTQRLLSRARQVAKVETDAALGRRLGFSAQRLSNYLTGKRQLDFSGALAVCTLLKCDPVETVRTIEHERCAIKRGAALAA